MSLLQVAQIVDVMCEAQTTVPLSLDLYPNSFSEEQLS